MSSVEWERPVDRFRRTAAGSVMAAGLLGLRDALEGRPEKDEPAIVVEAPAAPPPGDIEVLIDFERPGHALAIIHLPPEEPER
ncbi:MAG TPA: hypothetical protein VEP49_08510 [Acidimicrobiia bacterium]|nr:hypothetical protein [Acidimicrobiia bacterium]